MSPRVLGLLIFGAFSAAAAEPHITQVLSRRQARVGEPLELVVTVSHPPGQTWDLQVPEALGPFALLGRSAAVKREGDHEVDVLTLRLGVYELGKHLLPELTLRERGSGLSRPLARDAEVEIVSSLAQDDPRELRDVAPPRPVFVLDPRKVGAAAAALLAFAGLAVLAARAARRAWRRRFPPESEEARDRRLLGHLEGLDDEAFFDTLDGILRRGLARWHGVAARERTAEEIVSALQVRPPLGVSVDEVALALRESVLVRFAHRPTSAAQRRAAVAITQRLFPPPLARGARRGRPSLP